MDRPPSVTKMEETRPYATSRPFTSPQAAPIAMGIRIRSGPASGNLRMTSNPTYAESARIEAIETS